MLAEVRRRARAQEVDLLAPGVEPTDALAKDIQSFVKHRTAPYKYPRVIEFVERMPTTISGKIRRVVIRQESARRADGGPRTGDAVRQ